MKKLFESVGNQHVSYFI